MKLLVLALLVATGAVSAAADVKPQVQEAFALAEGMKMAIADYASHHDALPANNEEASLPEAGMIQGKYVASATVSPSRIDFEFGPGADASIQSKHLTLIGTLNADKTVAWACQSEDLPADACPTDCSCTH